MKTEWDEILKVLSDIEYDGDFTFEVDNLFANYPNELVPTAMNYMCSIGRYMINQIQKK